VEVGIWIGVVLVGLVAAVLALKRFLAPSSSDPDLGEVSQSWLTETRANKSER
jgi:hypothetical protein